MNARLIKRGTAFEPQAIGGLSATERASIRRALALVRANVSADVAQQGAA
jgi:hypothetical protein